MTVCVGVAVNDCLVFAADSASTLVETDAATGQSRVLNVYRHGNKVFNLHKRLPISAMTCGMGNVGPASIGALAKELRVRFSSNETDWRIDPTNYIMEEVARKARMFLFEECYQSLQPPPAAPHSLEFWLGGYGSDRKAGHEAWKIEIVNGQCANPQPFLQNGSTGIMVGGQNEPINRLLRGIGTDAIGALVRGGMDQMAAEQVTQHLSDNLEVVLLAPTMPVQDAIELATFLTELTTQFYRFHPGADIVGGETDVAVVSRHEGFKWIKRKHYYPAHLNPLETGHA